jgi:hypothetical protein
MSRNIAASLAAAAGSSIRSGNPCSTRERRVSFAPASRMASRSHGAMLRAPGNWPNLDGRWKAQIAQFGRSETVDRETLTRAYRSAGARVRA